MIKLLLALFTILIFIIIAYYLYKKDHISSQITGIEFMRVKDGKDDLFPITIFDDNKITIHDTEQKEGLPFAFNTYLQLEKQNTSKHIFDYVTTLIDEGKIVSVDPKLPNMYKLFVRLSDKSIKQYYYDGDIFDQLSKKFDLSAKESF